MNNKFKKIGFYIVFAVAGIVPTFATDFMDLTVPEETVKLASVNHIAPIINEIKIEKKTEINFSFINEEDNATSIAKKLSDNNFGFMAIATVVEDLKNKPYYDSGGLNIGMGYCITKRLESLGEEKVKSDLLKAGLLENDINTLISGNKKDILNLNISNMQSVNLLHQVSPEYAQIAKDNIGEDVFNNLSKKEQDVWTYFAWNTGDNMCQFKKLIAGIQEGDTKKVLKNLYPYFKDSEGTWQKNERLGTALQVALIEGHQAIANGEIYDHVSLKVNMDKKIKHIKNDDHIITKTEDLKDAISQIRLAANQNNSTSVKLKNG